MTQQHDKEYRDALLDELKAATEEWFDKEKERIENEVAHLKSVLKGRTGSERLQRATTEQSEILVIDDITTFLGGRAS